MKVGDYIRSSWGTISKIEKYTPFDDGIGFSILLEGDYNSSHYRDKFEFENCYKSSPNILELLEEHDFITIEYYSLRYDERVERIFEVDYKDNDFMTLKNAYCVFMLKNNEFNDNDKALEPIIKSIVTKEQFESIKYEV